MSTADDNARQSAADQYAAALAGLRQPAWPADRAPADPYGRALLLDNGDLVLQRDLDGFVDLAVITGRQELAQGIQVLVGTPLGSDIFNRIFGLDLLSTLAQPVPVRNMRELVRLVVVKALAQEQRIRQIQAIAFVDEPAYLTIHPEVTPEQQAALAREQRASRQWKLDVLLDTRLGDAVVAGIQGVGP
jgi:phage baseplate assembly protein W